MVSTALNKRYLAALAIRIPYFEKALSEVTITRPSACACAFNDGTPFEPSGLSVSSIGWKAPGTNDDVAEAYTTTGGVVTVDTLVSSPLANYASEGSVVWTDPGEDSVTLIVDGVTHELNISIADGYFSEMASNLQAQIRATIDSSATAYFNGESLVLQVGGIESAEGVGELLNNQLRLVTSSGARVVQCLNECGFSSQ